MSLKPVLRHPTPGASKNVKFRLSWNSTKFDVVARFHETIPTVKSVSSSNIYKNIGFLPKLPFCPFPKIGIFSGLANIPLRRLERMRKTTISDDYIIYLQDHKNDVGDVSYPTTYKESIVSPQSNF